MKLLLTGAGGQLGQCLQVQMANYYPCAQVWAPSSAELNLASLEPQVSAFAPAVIINAAAYNAVDRAQEETAQAYAVNAEGPACLARVAHRLGARLVHLSTDYVFSGVLSRPYTEKDEANPLNVYGASKRQGEQAVLDNCPSAHVVRTSWLFSRHGRNFVKTLLDTARSGQALRVVQDQVSTPTSADDLARALLVMIGSNTLPGGIYHFAGDQFISRYEWARQIMQCLDRQKGSAHAQRLQAITSADYGATARRPAWSPLDSSHLRQWLAQQGLAIAPVRQRLEEVVTALCGP